MSWDIQAGILTRRHLHLLQNAKTRRHLHLLHKDKKTSALALECKTTVSIVRYPCSPLKIYCFFHTPLRLVPHPDETLLCLDKKLHTCVASISTRSTYTVPRLVHLGPKEMHLDSADLLCALLVQLDVKLLLQSHHDLHSVERVSSQVHEL